LNSDPLIGHPRFAIAGQKRSFAELLGGDDCGRLRAFAIILDTKHCASIDFLTKFLSRSHSFDHMADVLLSIIRAQGKKDPETKENQYSRSAFTVHEALHNAVAKVLETECADNSVAATLIKFVGKGFEAEGRHKKNN
jgi:hypothetical protein